MDYSVRMCMPSLHSVSLWMFIFKAFMVSPVLSNWCILVWHQQFSIFIKSSTCCTTQCVHKLWVCWIIPRVWWRILFIEWKIIWQNILQSCKAARTLHQQYIRSTFRGICHIGHMYTAIKFVWSVCSTLQNTHWLADI